MAEYTTQLRSICESLAENEPGGYNQINQIISQAREKIFDFYYPIYKDTYKSVLETKIIRHYYTQEIGMETYGLWKLKLETRMNEIMPYYNLLYESADMKYNPITDYYMEKIHSGKNNSENSNSEWSNNQENNIENFIKKSDNTVQLSGNDTVHVKSDSTDDRSTNFTVGDSGTTKTITDENPEELTETAYSDTPQGSLSGVDRLEYLTNFTSVNRSGKNMSDTDVTAKNNSVNSGIDNLVSGRTDDTTTTYGKKDTGEYSENYDRTNSRNNTENKNNSGTANSTDEFIEILQGKVGGKSFPELIKEYRENLLNIDKMIIDQLSDLFMIIF